MSIDKFQNERLRNIKNTSKIDNVIKVKRYRSKSAGIKKGGEVIKKAIINLTKKKEKIDKKRKELNALNQKTDRHWNV